MQGKKKNRIMREKEFFFGGKETCSLIFFLYRILYVERPNNINSKDQQQQHQQKRKENDDNEKSKQARFVWFKPTDKRTPYIAIPVERAPLDVFQKADEYENTLLTVS